MNELASEGLEPTASAPPPADNDTHVADDTPEAACSVEQLKAAVERSLGQLHPVDMDAPGGPKAVVLKTQHACPVLLPPSWQRSARSSRPLMCVRTTCREPGATIGSPCGIAYRRRYASKQGFVCFAGALLPRTAK